MTFELKICKRNANGEPLDGVYLEKQFDTASELADFYHRNVAKKFSPRKKNQKDIKVDRVSQDVATAEVVEEG